MARTVLATALAALIAGGCSADDGGMRSDSGVIDAEPDGPTSLAYETQVSDLITGAALFDATVTEVGTTNSAQSAPNGRAILTLPANRTSQVSHELAGYLTNTTTVAADVLLSHVTANQPLATDLVTIADLETLYSGLGIAPPDSGATQLIVHVREADFSAAAGVTVTASASSQSFVRQGGGFEPGASPIGDPLLLFPNVVGSSTTITLSMSCPGPETIALEPGAIVSAFFLCDPSL